jgi:hypothetical protein
VEHGVGLTLNLRVADRLRLAGQPGMAAGSTPLHHARITRHADAMPDRPYPAVDALIRRVQRVAASRPDPLHILAQTISMTRTIGVDPYAVLGVLVEGAVQTLVHQIPPERQPEAAATLRELLNERLEAHGLPEADQ